MKFEVNFSNGAKTSFSIREIKGTFFCELLTGRFIDNKKNDPSAYSFISSITLETVDIKEKSLELVLKRTNEIIEKLKDPQLTFTITKIED